MKIILISGKAGSGKTSLAKRISELLPKTVITSFSKYIKLFALEMTDWKGNDSDKPREFLQNMGDTLRSIDHNFMCNRLMEDMKVYEMYYDYVIISDVRLVNELEYFTNNNLYETYSIRINNNDNRRNLNNSEMNHITETDLDNYNIFNLIIDDNDIDNNIDEIVEGLK